MLLYFHNLKNKKRKENKPGGWDGCPGEGHGYWVIRIQDPGERMLSLRPGHCEREPAEGGGDTVLLGALLQGTETRPGWQSAEAHGDKGRQEGSAFNIDVFGKENKFL